MVRWSDGGLTGGSVVKNQPANTGGVRDAGSVAVCGRSPGGGNDDPLQYCLGNSMDREAQRSTVHEVSTSWTYKDMANPCSHHVDWGGEVVSWEGMSSSGFGERSFPGNVFETFSLKSKQLTLGLTILILFLQGYLSSVH